MVASRVEDIYTREPITIEPETNLADIATLMAEKRIHFLPVMVGPQVEGVVGRRELLKALAERG